MKRTVNFKEWLAESGYLLPYVRARLTDDDWEGDERAPAANEPFEWMDVAFYPGATLEGESYWNKVSSGWDRHLMELPAGHRVELGLPLNDRLGMLLLFHELEGSDEGA